MLKTLTVTHKMPLGGMAFYIHGRNQNLILALQTGGYTLSGTPMRDPCRVEAFSSWLLDDNDQLYRGAHIQLGMLTGELNSALLILKGGIQGAGGDPHVVLRDFRSEWGLVTFVHNIVNITPGDYHLRTVVMYE
ncbi:unnamed protein product [marine sediment metagenome]|uniref:Uncharacterized protein n=1 Tax=marine sediment metagenome TaxID=412755 RepID=X1QPC9_9ZZZZ